MTVLLTGASGFVGSHILDRLRERDVDTVVLLRPTSSKEFLNPSIPRVEVRQGSILQVQSLPQALAGVTEVIHCAGCVKCARVEEFYEVNQVGTRNLVAAVNETKEIRRFVLVSSLAAAGPGTVDRPAQETQPPHPVSEYGRSKLGAEMELQKLRDAEPVILRPPAVYGPHDVAFLPLFKAVRRHLLPAAIPEQALSLVYVQDLANAIVDCVERPNAAGKTYFVAGTEIVTARDIAQEIARQMGTWTVPCPLPAAMLWPICLAYEIGTRLTGKAHILGLHKYPELRAPGWVCDGSLITREIGWTCATTLKQGISRTLEWYRQAQWL
jgi:nucleoside-diphosphate-sugar epimerase